MAVHYTIDVYTQISPHRTLSEGELAFIFMA